MPSIQRYSLYALSSTSWTAFGVLTAIFDLIATAVPSLESLPCHSLGRSFHSLGSMTPTMPLALIMASISLLQHQTAASGEITQ